RGGRSRRGSGSDGFGSGSGNHGLRGGHGRDIERVGRLFGALLMGVPVASAADDGAENQEEEEQLERRPALLGEDGRLRGRVGIGRDGFLADRLRRLLVLHLVLGFLAGELASAHAAALLLAGVGAAHALLGGLALARIGVAFVLALVGGGGGRRRRLVAAGAGSE